MCEEYAFPWKRKIVHSPRPQAEFDDCPKAANFAGNMPFTALIGRRLLISLKEEYAIIQKLGRTNETGKGWAVER